MITIGPNPIRRSAFADKIFATRNSIAGGRKLVTVMFANVSNFTSISEKLGPEEVRQIMDGCFKILMEEIHLYEGAIKQFMRDGVMALFGAPVAHEDHSRRACQVALAIQKVFIGYGEKIGKEYGVAFRMSMGLYSGPVIVGFIGDDLKMNSTAIGDTTTLASRMESAAKSETWSNGVLEKEIGCTAPTPLYSSGYYAFKRQDINKTVHGRLQKDYLGHQWMCRSRSHRLFPASM